MIRSTGRWIAAFMLASVAAAGHCAPRFSITFPPETAGTPLSGRLILVLSPNLEGEPREHVAWDGDAVPFFGIDVVDWKPGQKKVFDAKVDGFPLRSLDDLPAGEYRAQAVLNRYEKFTRSDGWTLLLPPDRHRGRSAATR